MKALKRVGIAVLALAVLLALFIAFGLNSLRGPVSRMVTEATGRELVIEGHIRPVWSWVHPRLRVERIRFANPGWAQEAQFFAAEAVEASVSLLPLLRGRVVLPEVHLEKPFLALERDAEGRKNWILEKDAQRKERSRLHVQRLTLDEGRLRYHDAGRDISLQSELSTDATGVVFAINGTYRGRELVAVGHAGHVLSIRDESAPFPIKAHAEVGATRARIEGEVAGLVGLKSVDLSVQLAGESLSHLYSIINVALPETPPYTTSGRLVREGRVVRYQDFTGKVGRSDLAGTLQVDTAGERPFMRGELVSRVMDLGDLGILVGTDRPRKKGVLPDSPFDPQRWGSVDADVAITAGTIKRPEQLPIENLSARIQMEDRVLTLDPLAFGIAGGRLAGPVVLDGTGDVIRARVRMRVEQLQLAKLFPTLKQNQGSAGDISGLIELAGRGNSVGQMLASADGKIGVFMDGGRISRLMMELVALDLWDAARVKLKGDETIGIRCAIADFGVSKGLMQTNAFVFDTSVVLVEGGGAIDLRSEEMRFKLDPKPKDSSIASLNSPLYVRGTFRDPQVSPDLGKLAARGLGAIVMGVINPVLAVLPLFKEKTGEDSNCGQMIAAAARKTGKAASAKPSPGPAAAGATKR